ncbi:MAG: hypothetical protein K2N38_02155 [Oscillospiraceae bacterium]|nr:hypothetical protein [Oscillospiraceae bacterium]
MKNAKGFLRSAVVLTVALIVICVFMPEWGVMQALIVLLVALLTGLQWFLFFYIKNIK